MRLDQIKEALHAQPFKPFTIRTSDGREFQVPHPEFVWLVPGMERTIFCAIIGRDAAAMIDPMHIVSLITGDDQGDDDVAHEGQKKAG